MGRGSCSLVATGLLLAAATSGAFVPPSPGALFGAGFNGLDWIGLGLDRSAVGYGQVVGSVVV